MNQPRKTYLISFLIAILLVIDVANSTFAESVNDSTTLKMLNLKKVKEHLDKGNTLYAKSHWEEAINEFKLASELYPSHPAPHAALCSAYVAKRVDELIKNVQNEVKSLFFDRSLIKKSDGTPEPITGEDENTIGLLQRMIIECNLTLELDDSIWSAHYFLGTHYKNFGYWEKAEPELKRAIELEPEYSNSYSVLGSLYEDMKNDSLAIIYHEKAIEKEPSSEWNHFRLARLYFKSGMTEAAKQKYFYLKEKNSILFKDLSDLKQLESAE